MGERGFALGAFQLDAFQLDAIAAIDRGENVLVAALRRTWKVSFVSWLWLSVMSRVMMLVVSAGAKVRVPLVAV